MLEKWFQNSKYRRLYYGWGIYTIQKAAVMSSIRQEYFVRWSAIKWAEILVCIMKCGN